MGCTNYDFKDSIVILKGSIEDLIAKEVDFWKIKVLIERNQSLGATIRLKITIHIKLTSMNYNIYIYIKRYLYKSLIVYYNMKKA